MEAANKFFPTSIEEKVEKSLKIIRTFEWLIDAYVIDFYVEDHWSKLSDNWRRHFTQFPPEYLSDLLNSQEKQVNCVWPLALLALRQLLQDLPISREVQNKHLFKRCLLVEHPKLRHLFTKFVKPKKRHEIERMAAFCKNSIERTAVDFIIDFGAGLGHLARLLGYGYGIKVCCLELQDALNHQARVIDTQLETMAAKHLSIGEYSHFQRPAHVTLQLHNEMHHQVLLDTIREAFELPTFEFTFGIIGLHPCGDLGVILMKMFLACKQAKFLNIVGCCYMKLSTNETQPDCVYSSYPLSRFLNHRQVPRFTQLSYTSREISCHATEMYCDRLRAGNYEDLKVHSFRAACERILLQYWPDMKHCGLRSVKHSSGMTFEEYFFKAVQGLPASTLKSAQLQTSATAADLSHWKRVVIFYTLRLLFAPLIESIILYDRMLFLQENDCAVEVSAIFDPYLSPRNHITSAIKRN